MKISQRKIKLEDRIIDLSNFEIRQKITGQDLQKSYQEFGERLPEIENYFENKDAYKKSINEAIIESPPKLIARERKQPFMWAFREEYHPFQSLLNPEKRRLRDELFVAAHVMINYRNKNEECLDVNSLHYDIKKRFEEYPGYECIIEVPNDQNQAETKGSVFHEGLHYVISRYQRNTGRNFITSAIDDKKRENLSDLERHRMEHILHERSVEILTDKLLNYDPDAQFENRWTEYYMFSKIKYSTILISAISTGVLIGATLINNPYLLPLALVPGRIRDFVLKEYKQSKKEEILKAREYPKFKI